MIAADGEVVQLSLAHAGETNRHAVGMHGQNDIIAIDFDPRKELMFWIDGRQRKVYRSALPKGINSKLNFPIFHISSISGIIISMTFHICLDIIYFLIFHCSRQSVTCWPGT